MIQQMIQQMMYIADNTADVQQMKMIQQNDREDDTADDREVDDR